MSVLKLRRTPSGLHPWCREISAVLLLHAVEVGSTSRDVLLSGVEAIQAWRNALCCRMENVIGRSVHLTPSGIDFDEHVFQLGQGTVVRAAGSLIFPR